MPNFYFGDHLDPEFIPKLTPREPNGDELGIFLIYGSNWTKFRLSGPFWQICNKTEMPNCYFGNDLDSEFIPKFIPRGPTGDEIGKFLI